MVLKLNVVTFSGLSVLILVFVEVGLMEQLKELEKAVSEKS